MSSVETTVLDVGEGEGVGVGVIVDEGNGVGVAVWEGVGEGLGLGVGIDSIIIVPVVEIVKEVELKESTGANVMKNMVTKAVIKYNFL